MVRPRLPRPLRVALASAVLLVLPAPAAAQTPAVDYDAPVVRIDAPLEVFLKPGAAQTFTFWATDDVDTEFTFTCSFGFGPSEPCTSPWVGPIASRESRSTFRVETRDRSGKAGVQQVFVHVDGTPPDLGWSSVAPADGVTIESSWHVVWEFTGLEPGLRGECRASLVDQPASEWKPCSNSFQTRWLPSGTYVLEARAFDRSGNESRTLRRGFTVIPTLLPAPPLPQAAPTPPVAFRYAYDYRERRGKRSFSSLRLSDLSAGATLSVSCKGGGCPARTGVKRRKDGTYSVPSLVGRKLAKGAVIEVTGTKPAAIGKVVRFTVRAGKLPKIQALCLPVGATAPGACAK